MDRRSLLKMGLLAPPAIWFAAASLQGGRGNNRTTSLPDALVIDQRYPATGRIEPGNAPVYAIDGDVTDLWYHTLDPAWRQPGFVVAGYTGADALFVLERLAWDRGRRVLERHTLVDDTGQHPALLEWLIAPVHPRYRAPS